MYVFLGVGNELRQDDSFGLRLLSKLESRLGDREDCKFIECGPAPISYLGRVPKEPEVLFILDAVDLPGLKPGEVLFKDVSDLRVGEGDLSTHRLPLTMLKGMVNPSETYLVGMKPIKMGYGEGVSPELDRAQEEAEKKILVKLKEKEGR